LASYPVRPRQPPGPCCIVFDQNDISGVREGAESYKTVYNVSTLNTLISATFADQTFVLLADPQGIISDLDFVTTTVGVNTQCVPITQQCNLTAGTITSSLFRCSSSVSGDLAKPEINNLTLDSQSNGEILSTVDTLFFKDSGLTQESFPAAPMNPLYMAFVAKLFNTGNDPDSSPNNQNLALVQLASDGVTFILWCNISVFDIPRVRLCQRLCLLIGCISIE